MKSALQANDPNAPNKYNTGYLSYQHSQISNTSPSSQVHRTPKATVILHYVRHFSECIKRILAPLEMRTCFKPHSTLRNMLVHISFSEASEASGADSLMSSRYIYIYLASERSERDTYRGNTIENRGCLFIGERA